MLVPLHGSGAIAVEAQSVGWGRRSGARGLLSEPPDAIQQAHPAMLREDAAAKEVCTTRASSAPLPSDGMRVKTQHANPACDVARLADNQHDNGNDSWGGSGGADEQGVVLRRHGGGGGCRWWPACCAIFSCCLRMPSTRHRCWRLQRRCCACCAPSSRTVTTMPSIWARSAFRSAPPPAPRPPPPAPRPPGGGGGGREGEVGGWVLHSCAPQFRTHTHTSAYPAGMITDCHGAPSSDGSVDGPNLQ